MDKILLLIAQLQNEVEALKATTAVYTQAQLDDAVQAALLEASHGADAVLEASKAAMQAQIDQLSAEKSALQAQVDGLPAAINAAVEDLKSQELLLEEHVEDALAALKGSLVPPAPATAE